MGKGLWFVFVSPRIPGNVQGNKPETFLAPEAEQPHELVPHPPCPVGTVQCWALWHSLGHVRVVECTKDNAAISFVQIIPFKGHNSGNQIFLEVNEQRVWTFEMADQSLCISLQKSLVSAFRRRRNYHFLLWTHLPPVELRGTCTP